MADIMATVAYMGELRTNSRHLRSGNQLMTDAPIDNQGKGEAFSPTDLVSSALCSCMMTIMGQVAARENINLRGLTGDVIKVMTSNPRKIGEIKIVFTHPNLEATDIQKQKLIHAARTCPVALSLNDSLQQTVEFKF